MLYEMLITRWHHGATTAFVTRKNNKFIIFRWFDSIGTISPHHRPIQWIAVGEMRIMMDNREFWRLIGAARAQAGKDENHQARLLIAALVALGVEAIMAFDAICRKFASLVIDRVDYEALGLTNVGEADANIENYAYGRIGQGENTYYMSLSENWASDDIIDAGLGSFSPPMQHVVPAAYLKCTGQDHPNWMGFSEYLSDTYLEDATLDEEFLKDFPANGAKILTDFWENAYAVQREIAQLVFRLPKWTRKTDASIALAKAGSEIKQLTEYIEDVIPEQVANIKKLVPDSPGHTTAP